MAAASRLAVDLGMLDESLPLTVGEFEEWGNPAGSKGIFAVLWDTTTNNVYVDTNQNNSFADESAMTDYALNAAIATIPPSSPDPGDVAD